MGGDEEERKKGAKERGQEKRTDSLMDKDKYAASIITRSASVCLFTRRESHWGV